MIIAISAIMSSVSFISGIITILVFVFKDVSKKTFLRSYILLTTLFLISSLTYTLVINEKHNDELNMLKNEYLVLDSKITSQIDGSFTNTYEGYLGKLALLVSFYERHSNVYNSEYLRFSTLYDDYRTERNESAKENRRSIFDMYDVKDTVEVGVHHIHSILSENSKNQE